LGVSNYKIPGYQFKPKRPRVDRAVLDFIKSSVFDPADFVIRSDGVCRLNPQMARTVVAKVSA
jgi:CRISP-associated protein Cas1